MATYATDGPTNGRGAAAAGGDTAPKAGTHAGKDGATEPAGATPRHGAPRHRREHRPTKASARLDAWLHRRFDDPTRPRRYRRARAVANALVFVLAAYVAFVGMQLPSAQLAAFTVLPWYVLLNLAIMLLAMLVLYCLCQRRLVGVRIVLAACGVIGLIQRYVILFRGSAITPVDLYAIGTAAAVAGQYDYTPDAWCVAGVAVVALACVLLALVQPQRPRGQHPVRTNLLAALGCAAALAAGVTIPSYTDVLGVWLNQWHINECYQQQGFFPVFVAAAQDMVLNPPEGYDEQQSEQYEADLAAAWEETDGSTEERAEATRQFSDQQPCIVAIMNESFADVSTFDRIIGYDGPTYVRDELASESVLSGRLGVSVNGAGTCNTEFEFLTGLPMSYLGNRKYPYVQYNFSTTPNLARQLGELGYDTCAMHPNLANNWSRKKVYAQMGFDRFLTIDDFQGARHYHNGVADGETYDKILEILKSDDDPQFVFDVTMQNHSGYDVGNIPAADQVDYQVSGFYGPNRAVMNEYISCVNASERDLREFIDELRELDRPVIVVFFGDHQPYFTDWFRTTAQWNGDISPSRLEEEYETLYFVWANYDIAGTSEQVGVERDVSVANLAATMLDAVGAPMSTYQEAELQIEKDLPMENCYVLEDPEGTWFWLDATAEDGVPQATIDAREKWRMITYRYYDGFKN